MRMGVVVMMMPRRRKDDEEEDKEEEEANFVCVVHLAHFLYMSHISSTMIPSWLFSVSSPSSDRPFLMYFLQLSQAPPELDMEMANCTEEPKDPVKRPKTAWTPKKVPAIKGDKITRQAGATISLIDAVVEIWMQVLLSGFNSLD